MPEEYEKQHVNDLFAPIAGSIYEKIDNAIFLVEHPHPSGNMCEAELEKSRRGRLAVFAEDPDFPPYAQQAIKKYRADPRTVEQATAALNRAASEYREVFSNFGIKPKDTKV